LSYRRADTAPHALALKLELETRLHAAQVFLDTHTIQGGDIWPSEIQDALNGAKAIILLIGKSWEGQSEGAQRRIDDPLDWVHRETKFALEEKRGAVIPLFIDGATPLSPDRLPIPLRPLASIHGRNINVDNWDNDVGALIGILKDKSSFQPKNPKYKLPKPDPLIAATVPFAWNDLETQVLQRLRDWRIEFTEDPDRLHYKRVELTRDFELKSFGKAIEFVDVVARHATEMNHHPRIMNLWKTVTIWLTTWAAGYWITVLDVRFAQFLERKYKEFS